MFFGLTNHHSLFLYVECGKRYVRRRPGEEFNPQCVTPTMKHGGGKILVWGCFTARDVGHIHHIKGIMDQKANPNSSHASITVPVWRKRSHDNISARQ